MRPDAILQTLERAGFEARYVGGCVRDTLLGRPVHDWDIASQALPEDVLRLFPRCVPTGLQHGTVTVLLDGTSAEVTTYRLDGAYHDSRHPDGVRFVRSLADDLARRDFTINAMAMDLSGTITDLFGGREDLARGVIRCVGDAETRFREDALRMLRARRFAAQLGFALEAGTEAAIGRCAALRVALPRAGAGGGGEDPAVRPADALRPDAGRGTARRLPRAAAGGFLRALRSSPNAGGPVDRREARLPRAAAGGVPPARKALPPGEPHRRDLAGGPDRAWLEAAHRRARLGNCPPAGGHAAHRRRAADRIARRLRHPAPAGRHRRGSPAAVRPGRRPDAAAASSICAGAPR